MWFGGEKVGFDHKLLWFGRDFWAKKSEKMMFFDPQKRAKI
jgi:hypothetical protein